MLPPENIFNKNLTPLNFLRNYTITPIYKEKAGNLAGK
jgi:hypothetical protein